MDGDICGKVGGGGRLHASVGLSEMCQLFPLQENMETHSEGVYEPQRGPEGSLGASFNDCSDVTLIRINRNILWKKPQDRWASPIALRNGCLEN